MSDGMVFWPKAKAALAYAANRVQWAIGGPSQVGNGTDMALKWYRTVRGAIGSVTGASSVLLKAPALFTGGWDTSSRGMVGRFGRGTRTFGLASLNEDRSNAIRYAGPLIAPTGYPTAPALGVIVFGEVIKFTSGQPVAGEAIAHGFAVLPIGQPGVDAATGPLLAAGGTVDSLRYIGLVRLNGNTYAVAHRGYGEDAATVIPLPASLAYNGAAATPSMVEHRLYAATASDPGRYELRINGTLAVVVSADADNFPFPDAAGEALCPMPAAWDGNGVTGPLGDMIYVYASEVYQGPDTPGTFA